jgi:hypothetical protein
MSDNDNVNLGSLLSDPNFAALVAGAAAQTIQQTTTQETTTMQTTSNLPANVLSHLQAKGMNAADVAEIEKRVDKPGRLPAKYSVLIKEVRKMLKAQQPAQNAPAATSSQVSVGQLSASLNEVPKAPPAKAAPAKAAPEGEEVWEKTPVAAYQLGASTQLRVNRSSTGRIGFRVFFVRRGETDYQPTKKGFTLAPNQLEHLKSVL